MNRLVRTDVGPFVSISESFYSDFFFFLFLSENVCCREKGLLSEIVAVNLGCKRFAKVSCFIVNVSWAI